jgi:DNA polymerase-3 subunit epsilon
MQVLLQSARVKRFSIRAKGAPFESKDDLRKRGHRWDPGNNDREKAWWTIVEDTEAELEWLGHNIYHNEVDLPVKAITATDRFSIRGL